MYYSGIDKDICFEQFVAEFKLTARTNEWSEKDYALILGVYLQGPAQYFFRYTYHDDIEFATLCELLRSEFPCECFNCKHRAALEVCVMEENPMLCGEGGPSSVLNEDDNAVLYSSMTDDPQNDEPSDDDDDQSCNVSSQEDEDDQGCGVSSHDDIDDQGCDVSGQISDETATEDTDEDRSPVVFSPIIISSVYIPENQDTFFTKSENDHEDVSKGNYDDDSHNFENKYVETKSFLQNETKEMTQVIIKEVDHSPMIIYEVDRFDFSGLYNKLAHRVPCKTKKCMEQKGMATRKSSRNVHIFHRIKFKTQRCMARKSMARRKSVHHENLNKIKSQLLNCEYYCNKFKKHFFLSKHKFWKFYKKKLDVIFYNYKVRKRFTLRNL
ncbi:hypothetical protein PYW08_005508 [Mythimna loreyi]|uniref:Uncharacterized protein n=1 Tax=Mythimna loreyi TaxID=667449 RepID=A0ACC2QJB2_9NEOP|nr:hypothetical protein PYW08_005508 [Mythimna loreyi]